MYDLFNVSLSNPESNIMLEPSLPNTQDKWKWFCQLYLARYAGFAGFFIFLLLSLACSAGTIVQRNAVNATVTRALVPTFTPTPLDASDLPQIIVTPPSGSTPGIIIIPEGMDPSLFIPTDTPTPVLITPDQPPSADQTPMTPIPVGTPLPPELQTLVPTDTPIPTATAEPTLTATPTPYVLVESGLVTLRTGPGVEFPLVAQLGPQIPIAIVGRSNDANWYQLCCVNGGTVWVAATHVKTVNDAGNVPEISSGPPPAATPTATFTATPTETPTATPTLFPFDRSVGPLFFPTQNEFLTIWVKLFVGTPPNEDPATGYFLKVLFEGIERPPSYGIQPSIDQLYAVGLPGTGNSNLSFNLKYEYHPPDPNTLDPTDPSRQEERRILIGNGIWRVYVIDGAGNQLSDVVEFRTEPGNPNREVYIAWERKR